MPTTLDPSTFHSPTLPTAPTADFPYRVEHVLGQGGMGVVYRALEPSLGRPVAIKVLRPEVFATSRNTAELSELRLRFLQEARSAAAIVHPGAVTIFRVGKVDDLPFLAMEWLDGEPLSARLARETTLGVDVVVDLALQVLDVLRAAHQAGVVHRDIKPGNLLVLRDGRIKVTDFGIAQFRSSNLLLTQVGTVLGTPSYAAPEQLRGEEVDGRSDLYALGVVLYEALAGRHPYSGANLPTLIAQVLAGSAPPLGRLRPDLPVGLVAVVERALAVERARRFPHAEAMAEALRAQSPGPPLFAGRPATWPPAPRATRHLHWQRNLPSSPLGMLAATAAGWPCRDLPAQEVEGLLLRLLDRPLHAPAFSGAVRLGDVTVFLAEGELLGAVDERRNLQGDLALGGLPERSAAVLHPLPAELPSGAVAALLALLSPSPASSALAAALIDPVALERHLGEQHFSGILRLGVAGADGYVAFVDGRPCLGGGSAGFAHEGPSDTPWAPWLAALGTELALLPTKPQPLALASALRLRDVTLIPTVRDATNPGTDPATLSPGRSGLVRTVARLAPRTDRRRLVVDLTDAGGGAVDPAVERDCAARLLGWLLTQAPGFFAERGIVGKWKFLAEWIPEIRRARLHHHLPDPGRQSPTTPVSRRERFNLATFDEAGKVLHLALRLDQATPQSLEAAVARLTAAKRGRLESGDVGAGILVAPSFDAATIEAYLALLQRGGRGMADLIDSLTGYAGFLRLGPRRGYHLLLVEETPQGFQPVLI